jgi:hypothetical protein
METDPNTDEAYQALVPGLTSETIAEFRVLGLSPEQAELGYRRQADIDQEKQQRDQSNAEAVLAAKAAVDTGHALPAEAAEALRLSGLPVAANVFTSDWLAEQRAHEAVLNLNQVSSYDAETYAAWLEDQQEQARAKDEAAVQAAGDDLARAQISQVRDALLEYAATVPGAHENLGAVEARARQIILENGAPDTPEDVARLVEIAIRDVVQVDTHTESINQQVETEWRIHRKQSGGRDGLVTAADIATAKAAFKSARFAQLAGERIVDHTLPPTAEEASSALTEKFRSKQERSTSHQQNVSDINRRGRDAAATRDRGVGITEEKRAYREAMQRAEERAAFGEYAGIRSGYGPNAVDAPEMPPPVDQYGPGGYTR